MTYIEIIIFFPFVVFFHYLFFLSEFLRLYLLVYVLPCGGGTVFPAMVLDNI